MMFNCFLIYDFMGFYFTLFIQSLNRGGYRGSAMVVIPQFHSIPQLLVPPVFHSPSAWVPCGVQGMTEAMGWHGIPGGNKKGSGEEGDTCLWCLYPQLTRDRGSPKNCFYPTPAGVARTSFVGYWSWAAGCCSLPLHPFSSAISGPPDVGSSCAGW